VGNVWHNVGVILPQIFKAKFVALLFLVFDREIAAIDKGGVP